MLEKIADENILIDSQHCIDNYINNEDIQNSDPRLIVWRRNEDLYVA